MQFINSWSLLVACAFYIMGLAGPMVYYGPELKIAHTASSHALLAASISRPRWLLHTLALVVVIIFFTVDPAGKPYVKSMTALGLARYLSCPRWPWVPLNAVQCHLTTGFSDCNSSMQSSPWLCLGSAAARDPFRCAGLWHQFFSYFNFVPQSAINIPPPPAKHHPRSQSSTLSARLTLWPG